MSTRHECHDAPTSNSVWREGSLFRRKINILSALWWTSWQAIKTSFGGLSPKSVYCLQLRRSPIARKCFWIFRLNGNRICCWWAYKSNNDKSLLSWVTAHIHLDSPHTKDSSEHHRSDLKGFCLHALTESWFYLLMNRESILSLRRKFWIKECFKGIVHKLGCQDRIQGGFWTSVRGNATDK